VIFGDGTQTRDFTYISDTVKGIIMASQSDSLIGQTVNIARGQEVSINHLARIISDKLGKNAISPVHERQRPGDVMRHYADIAKAGTLLGFQPEVDIQQGISKYVDWFLSQNYDISELLQQESVFNW
jgi:UDP-glucose 4-epimerase